MSDNVENISKDVKNIETEKPIEEPITKKDPRRVEQGKRLTAISKQAKENKMREKIMQEYEDKKSYTPYVIYTIGGISIGGLLYLLIKKDFSKDEYKATVIHHESPKKFENLN